MKKQDKLYDVYVSYPPEVDKERIHACLYDNLPENEADELIQALSKRPQAIIAENCTLEEREHKRHYFNYLGLDVIIRQALELEPDFSEPEESKEWGIQCPVCLSLIENKHASECGNCHFALDGASEQSIRVKRIEWQEKIAFEHKKQTEIALKLEQEKEREEQRLRKQIRAELETKLRQELAQHPSFPPLHTKRKNHLLIAAACAAMFGLIAIGYVAAKYI